MFGILKLCVTLCYETMFYWCCNYDLNAAANGVSNNCYQIMYMSLCFIVADSLMPCWLLLFILYLLATCTNHVLLLVYHLGCSPCATPLPQYCTDNFFTNDHALFVLFLSQTTWPLFSIAHAHLCCKSTGTMLQFGEPRVVNGSKWFSLQRHQY